MDLSPQCLIRSPARPTSDLRVPSLQCLLLPAALPLRLCASARVLALAWPAQTNSRARFAQDAKAQRSEKAITPEDWQKNGSRNRIIGSSDYRMIRPSDHLSIGSSDCPRPRRPCRAAERRAQAQNRHGAPVSLPQALTSRKEYPDQSIRSSSENAQSSSRLVNM